MAKTFATSIQQNMMGTTTTVSNEVMDTIFNFAEMAVETMGLDFSPTPLQMEKLVEQRHSNKFGNSTRLFCFDQDDLDSTQSFTNKCESATVSGLTSTHLSPVYFAFASDEIPVEARAMAQEAGFQSVSYGATTANLRKYRLNEYSVVILPEIAHKGLIRVFSTELNVCFSVRVAILGIPKLGFIDDAALIFLANRGACAGETYLVKIYDVVRRLVDHSFNDETYYLTRSRCSREFPW